MQRMSRRKMVAQGGMAAGLLAAGCAPGAGGGPGAAAGGGDTGRVVHWSTEAFTFQESIGAELAAEFRAKYPKIEYVAETIVGNRFEKLVTAAAAGSAPDVGMAGIAQIAELAANGIAAPVDEYLKASRIVKQADLWPTLVNDLVYKQYQEVKRRPWAPHPGSPRLATPLHCVERGRG